MSTEAGVSLGKTAFLEAYLPSNKDANLTDANKAWNAAGNEGTLSESLFGKVRAKLGMTGRGGASPKKQSASSKAKAKSVVVKKVTKPASPKPDAEVGEKPAAKPVVKEVKTRAKAVTATVKPTSIKSNDRAHKLVQVEDTIDDLILGLKEIGGLDDALESLRKARRVVVRGHEG